MNNIVKLGAVIATVSLLSTTVFAAVAKDTTTTTKEVSTEKSATMGTAIDDTAITAKVKAALMNDSRTSGLKTNVETVNGVIMLKGMLKTESSQKAAIEVAQEIADKENEEAKSKGKSEVTVNHENLTFEK